jgi:Family of unknown function (DUF5824)
MSNSIEPIDLFDSFEPVISAGQGPCWEGYVQIGMKEKDGKMVPNCVPKDSAAAQEFAGSRPAPAKDRIHGSSRNAKGSAKGGKKIVFSAKVEASLRNKVTEHNKKASEGRKATLGMLKAVYRRGAGAFSSSHRPGMTRDQWAMGRVNAFLRLLRSGRPANSNYKQDNDLLPHGHPRSTKSVKASGDPEEKPTFEYNDDEEYGYLVELQTEDDYESPEHAILAMAELSELSYDIIPALRAAWLRGVRDNESPYNRALVLASALYSSKDADLLPVKGEHELDA